jgi:acetylornithine deacetylase/succinyl-diaminopimelate desuccinylase-like protein
VQGIVGGYDGPSYYTMMPGQARARLDFRFPPGIEPPELADLVRAHLDRRGYGDVRLTGGRGYAGSPALPEERDTLLRAARTTAAAHGVAVDVWPIANNCCPAALFTGLGRQLPFSIAGTGHGDRPHAPDEYITLGSVRALMDWTVDYLDTWAAIVVEEKK